jgi:hypothetical protein
MELVGEWCYLSFENLLCKNSMKGKKKGRSGRGEEVYILASRARYQIPHPPEQWSWLPMKSS